MDINAKIKTLAETMSGYSVIVDSSNGANVELSKVTMPCILVFIQDTGEYLSANSHYRDSVNIKIAFLNKIPKGFKESDVETMRYDLKNDMVLLYHKLKFDFQFKINNNAIKYEIVYDEFDENLIGVTFSDNVKERVGLNLACETPDSIGEIPSSISFCQKVSECSTIISMQELIESLQEQIDNLPTTTGVESVSGNQVNNTDPLNPIIEPLGLIKIVDLAGDFFTDLASATTYIEQFITPGVITDKSFNEGIFFFTVPYNTQINGYFLIDNITPAVTYASLIDRFGLLDLTNAQGFGYMNAGNHIIGDGYFMYSAFNFFTGSVEMNSLFITASGGNFAESSTGKFIIKENIGINETAQFGVNFFLNSTATIFANASKYTSNAGGIHGDLQTAITNGCNVFFDGIDKENIKNKVLNFNSPNNTDYATTQATKDLIDYYVQSNIRIIGDWNAASGQYPLADESNTTPFITQWGSTIKQGWAFRVGYGQAGTVGGYDYEEGDVVYALLDNAGATSADWGDLDHNLQQATESLRGTGKVITAAIIADETTTDDQRFVTGLKLWQNFWTRVLAIAHTFAAKITFSTAPRFSSVTASQYLKVDASKDLSSVSAIPAPDVTEDSTHRFITDVERLKWNKFSYTDTVLGTVSSGTSNTLSKSVLIPANTLTSGLLNIIGRSVKTGTGSFGWLNIYINTSNSMSGAKHLGQINNAANNTILHWSLSRAIPIQSGSFTAFITNSISGSNDVITNNVSTVTIDWTVNQYIILSVQANNGVETVTANFLSVVQH